MAPSRRSLAGLVLALTLGAAPPGHSQDGLVTVRVVTPDGALVPDASVNLLVRTQTVDGVRVGPAWSRTRDYDATRGEIVLSGLPSAEYIVSATALCYASPVNQLVYLKPAGQQALTVVVRRTGSISGLVLDHALRPVPNAMISINAALVTDPLIGMVTVSPQQRCSSGPKGSLSSDANGRFHVVDVPPGSYYVSAMSKTGGIWFYPGARTRADAVPIEVREGESVENVNLPRTLSLRAIVGQVTDEQGGVPPVLEVEYGNEGGPHRGFATFREGASDFVIDDQMLRPGRIGVFARAESSQGTMVAHRTFDMLDGGPNHLALLLRAPGRIDGRFLPDKGITALPPIGQLKFIPDGFMPLAARDHDANADDSGVFTLDGLLGRYRIEVELPEGWAVNRVERDGKTLESSGLDIAEGDHLELRFVIGKR